MRIFCGWGGVRWPDWWVCRGREAGVRSAAGDRQRGFKNAGAKKRTLSLSLSLSLSLNFSLSLSLSLSKVLSYLIYPGQ